MSFENVKKIFERLLASPFGFTFQALTVTTTVWGVVEIFHGIAPTIGDPWAWVIVGFLSVGPLVCFSVTSLFHPNFRRQFRLPPGQRFIYLDNRRTWEIKADGRSTFTIEKTFVFTETPDPVDMSDTIFGSNTQNVQAASYQSQDAVANNWEIIGPGKVRFFWKPKTGSVLVGEPYKHNIVFGVAGTAGWEKSTTMASASFCAKYDLDVKSERPVRQMVIFRAGLLDSYKNPKKLARKAMKLKQTNAPLPTKISDHEFTWTITGLQSGDIYYCVLIFSDPPNT